MALRVPSLALLAATLAGCAAVGAAAGTPSRPGGPGRFARYRVVAQPPPGTCHARGRGLYVLPDPRCTPGAVAGAVTQADIERTICRRGYTRTVRPPEWVTEVEKRASMAAYGDRGRMRAYEYDHLIPLELGGAPNDPHNLWPEPGATPNPKDRLEFALTDLVCEHALRLGTAQRLIGRDWVAAGAWLHRRLGDAFPWSER